MNYRTYKSKHFRQGVAGFKGKDGKTRFETFEKHTLLVPEDDIELINELERVMAKEKELNLPRTIFTPLEFAELMTPENAYFEHTTRGKIPFREIERIIDFAYSAGYQGKEYIPTPKKNEITEGTKTSGTFKTK